MNAGSGIPRPRLWAIVVTPDGVVRFEPYAMPGENIPLTRAHLELAKHAIQAEMARLQLAEKQAKVPELFPTLTQSLTKVPGFGP